ncbi:helix-turn-helix domain-containing protein [Nocardia heshunensis]
MGAKESRDGFEDSDLTLGDPALLEVVISAGSAISDRARALRLLGITPSTKVALIAVAGPVSATKSVSEQIAGPGIWSRSAALGPVDIIATTARVDRDIVPVPDARIAVGPAREASECAAAWRSVLACLRFSIPLRTEPFRHSPISWPVVYQADMGAFELIARHVASADITGIADVEALDRLAAESTGEDLLATLEVFTGGASLRDIARRMHLHHNSVATRIERAEAELGFSVRESFGLLRLAAALTARRLRENDLLE